MAQPFDLTLFFSFLFSLEVLDGGAHAWLPSAQVTLIKVQYLN